MDLIKEIKRRIGPVVMVEPEAAALRREIERIPDLVAVVEGDGTTGRVHVTQVGEDAEGRIVYTVADAALRQRLEAMGYRVTEPTVTEGGWNVWTVARRQTGPRPRESTNPRPGHGDGEPGRGPIR